MRDRSFPFSRATLTATALAALGACSFQRGATGAPPSPAPVQATGPVAGFSHVKTLEDIQEYVLDANGLRVLIKPDRSAPVVTFMVTYRVGSRNEVTGTTGATHLLEHLMFKGTDAHNDAAGTSVKQYLESVGARFNATTSMDRTNYYATIGKDHLEGYVAIEADRMRNLWLREEDRKAEMTVVRNEYERGENDPGEALYKEVMAAAFLAHPYHHPIIGWRSDIENVPIERLREFYDTYYWPENATITVVGDVEPAGVLALIRKHFGGIPAAPRPIPEVYTVEPPQSGPRRVTVQRPGQIGIVMVGYKAVNALHPDMPALDVLGSILGDGKTGRLYRELVDKGLALRAFAGVFRMRDPGLFTVSADLSPGVLHEKAEQALIAQIERIRTEGVTQAEIDDAVRRRRAELAFRRDGTTATAAELNEWVSAGDWTGYVTYIDRMAAVTPADVKRVAQTYLTESQSTTGWFVPVTSK